MKAFSSSISSGEYRGNATRRVAEGLYEFKKLSGKNDAIGMKVSTLSAMTISKRAPKSMPPSDRLCPNALMNRGTDYVTCLTVQLSH